MDLNDPLSISSFGIPQINKLKRFSDILFVPVVAFDKNGNRIGYGGGFYDRYLEKISKLKMCNNWSAFSHQKVDKIKVESFDKN